MTAELRLSVVDFFPINLAFNNIDFSVVFISKCCKRKITAVDSPSILVTMKMILILAQRMISITFRIFRWRICLTDLINVVLNASNLDDNDGTWGKGHEARGMGQWQGAWEQAWGKGERGKVQWARGKK